MKGVNNFTKWESVIEWFDESKYRKLSEGTKKQLNEFRRINHYITTLKNSIETREVLINKLKGEISQRVEGVRKHKNNGNKLYDKLVSLKKEKEVRVYYTEGTTKKKLKGNNWSVYGSEKIYTQTNIKYKLLHSKSMKTINLKPNRSDTINEIKSVCPSWYSKHGKVLNNLDWNDRSGNITLKRMFSDLFKTCIEEIIERNTTNQKSSIDFTIKFEDIKEVLKKKKY
jgi:hypothetical protein